MVEKTILLAEGEEIIADRLCKLLKGACYKVDLAFDGIMAKHLLDMHRYDLAVVDCRLPDTNGLELCNYIRQRDGGMPLMMLSSGLLEDNMEIFRSGADDFCSLTEDGRVLLMRIKVLTKRSSSVCKKKNWIRAGDIMMDLDSKEVIRNGREILLSAKEFLLLQCLIENKNRIMSRKDIAGTIWTCDLVRKDGRVAALINSVRKKIGEGNGETFIFTVTGKGYLITGKALEDDLLDN